MKFTISMKSLSDATSGEILKLGLKFGVSDFDVFLGPSDIYTRWAKWSVKATLT